VVDSRRSEGWATYSLPERTHTGATSLELPDSEPRLAAKLNLFDATMIVMGGIVGSGIFINPHVVAELLHTPALILATWLAGGAIALVGAFIYAELADRMPEVGGQYAYLRDAYHPAVGFLYGWVGLLVIHAGGTAAVVVTFAKYFKELTHGGGSENAVSIAVIIALTVINCLGVRAGGSVQSGFMILRIFAIAIIVGSGAWFILDSPAPPPVPWRPVLDRPVSFGLLSVFGAAMVPVLFGYGGWQTSNYIAAEIREPRKNLPRALVLGVVGIIVLYLTANFVYVQTLSPGGLAGSSTPASAVMRLAFGNRGASLVAALIAISTVGFLSHAMLSCPRMYFAMAADGVLPAWFARLGARTRVPTATIILQGAVTIAVVLLGTYEQILSYVVVMDWLFFGLTASCIFVFRARERRLIGSGATKPGADAARVAGFRAPGHPWTTALFIAVAWLVTGNTIYKYPRNAAVALCILFAGIPFYYLFRGRARRSDGSE
jgi:APA family basic amino acid/polyamine antiporter